MKSPSVQASQERQWLPCAPIPTVVPSLNVWATSSEPDDTTCRGEQRAGRAHLLLFVALRGKCRVGSLRLSLFECLGAENMAGEYSLAGNRYYCRNLRSRLVIVPPLAKLDCRDKYISCIFLPPFPEILERAIGRIFLPLLVGIVSPTLYCTALGTALIVSIYVTRKMPHKVHFTLKCRIFFDSLDSPCR